MSVVNWRRACLTREESETRVHTARQSAKERSPMHDKVQKGRHTYVPGELLVLKYVHLPVLPQWQLTARYVSE
jgi:hypothetical protein